jgi:hypothetical protein
MSKFGSLSSCDLSWYKACTQEYIAFLHTCITGSGTGRPKLAKKDFWNVSIITAWNSQKDRINELGSV